jgi:hypothetical protein
MLIRDVLDKAIIESLPLFSPLGGGTYKELAELTIMSANQTLPLMELFAKQIGAGRILQWEQAASLCNDSASRISSETLKNLFEKYGTDKSSHHEYHYIYGSLFKNPEAVTSILEIGLGTNDTNKPSNMGNDGKPGASLRAFRDYFINANVYGADIDKQILFEEDRIKTFYVDQTNLSTFDVLGKSTESSFDLIIDDGLHCPNANLVVLIFGLKRLKPNGWLIIEDIKDRSVPIWRIIAALLPVNYRSFLIADKFGSTVFMIKNTSNEK